MTQLPIARVGDPEHPGDTSIADVATVACDPRCAFVARVADTSDACVGDPCYPGNSAVAYAADLTGDPEYSCSADPWDPRCTDASADYSVDSGITSASDVAFITDDPGVAVLSVGWSMR